MTIGLWFLRAFGFLKPFLPYIAAVLIVFGLLSAYGHREFERGKAHEVAKYQPVMQRATDRVNLALRVLKSADTTMKLQSASIRAQAGAQQAALANAYKEIAAADKRDVSRKAQIQRLQVDAAKPVDGPPCDLSDEVKADWK